MTSCLPCRVVALCCALCVVLGPASGFFLPSRRNSQSVESSFSRSSKETRDAAQPSRWELLTILKDVEKDVKDVKEDVQDLKTSVDDIRQEIRHLTQQQSNQSEHISNDNDKDQPVSTFRVTTVATEPRGDGHIVHLQLTGDPLPRAFHMVGTDSGQIVPREEPVLYDGSVEFFSQSHIMQIILLHPKGFHNIEVHLNGTRRQQVPEIGLFLDTGTEVTFTRGQEHVDVNATLRVNSPSETSLFINRSFKRINTTDPTFVTERDREAVLQLVDEGETEQERFLTLRVNTSSEEAEGILGITGAVNFRCHHSPQSCLIQYYSIDQHVPVYMTEHSGPFPPGYLGFFGEDEVKEFQYCSPHNDFPCFLSCHVMGDRPSPVDIVVVDEGGGLQVESQFAVNTDYWSLGQVTFANVTRGMSGTFRCSSHSASGLGEVSRVIRYDVIYEAQITDTSVDHVVNNTTEVTCKAEGSPPPHVIFTYSNETIISEDDIDSNNAINVTYTISDVTTEVVLRVDKELANEIGEVTCVASNMENSHSYKDTRRLYLDDHDLPDNVRYYLEN